jgi:prepilin-type N-terminal cleavage/methylation domain-containing protein
MRGNRASGFTITELVTVVAIMGILFTMAAISMVGYVNRTKLRTALYVMDSDIRQARWIAQGTANTCFIKFDTLANSYTINGTQYASLPNGIRFGVDPSVTGCPSAPSTPPPGDGISFDSSGHKDTLIYYPTGSVVPAGTVYLTDGSQTMAVRVARTGRPKLWFSGGGTKWTAH